MRSKIKRVLIAAVIAVAAIGVLLISADRLNEPKPEPRLSWQEQLTRVYQTVAEVDPDATLGALYASMFFDEDDLRGINAQHDPLPVTSVLFRFYGKEPYKNYALGYYDIFTDALGLDKNTGILPFDDDRIPLAQLSTLIKIGPFDACQSTLPMVQQMMHAEITRTRCSASLYQGWLAKHKFGVSAVWSITWTSYEVGRKSQEVDIWLDAKTGKRLKLETDVRKES